jgi:hypothetical protein
VLLEPTALIVSMGSRIKIAEKSYKFIENTTNPQLVLLLRVELFMKLCELRRLFPQLLN